MLTTTCCCAVKQLLHRLKKLPHSPTIKKLDRGVVAGSCIIMQSKKKGGLLHGSNVFHHYSTGSLCCRQYIRLANRQKEGSEQALIRFFAIRVFSFPYPYLPCLPQLLNCPHKQFSFTFGFAVFNKAQRLFQ